MNRVEAAIKEGRCVLAVGGSALRTPAVLAELNRRAALPIVCLGSQPAGPATPVDSGKLSAALDHPGGVVVLIEPDPASDGRGLGSLESLVRGAAHKPRLVIASRSFNPFGLPMGLRMLKYDHEKKRAADFLGLLSVPAGPPVPASPAAEKTSAAPKKRDGIRAPMPELVGREEELAALGALLAEDGGAIVVTGPSGVGRSWLVDAAIQATDLERLPDIPLLRGVGADTLLAQFAVVAQAGGDDRLHTALTGKERPAPLALASLVAEVLAGEAFTGKAIVFSRLEQLLDRRDDSFRNDGRLELILRALLTSTPAGRLVFISERAPAFYREGEALGLRVLELGGIKGRELHGLFEQYSAPEFPRDRFGPISDRTHGHPIAARSFAIAAREEDDVEELLEQPRFLKAGALADLAPLKRHLKKKVESLDDATRALLGALSTAEIPVGGDMLRALGVKRATRIQLLANGLLEQTPVLGEGRRYSVHPLVREHLTFREVKDFEVMETVARQLHDACKAMKRDGDLPGSISLAYSGNRLLVGARRGRSRLRLPYPDGDATLDDLRAMVRRRKNPRHDLARQRLNESMKREPHNTELLILNAELCIAEKAGAEAVSAAFARAAEAAPTPEVFHAEANWHGNQRRGKAAAALERGIEAFPEDARMKRRVAGFYIAQNRLDEAAEVLRLAQELEPMMPDTYGMLGEIYTLLGPDRWEDAVSCIEEALRLSPEHPLHLCRKARLLRRKAAADADAAAALLEEAEALATAALGVDKGDSRVQVLVATLILDRGGDAEKARWLLQQALKQKETPEALLQRARVLVVQGHLDEGERVLDKAIKKAPSAFEAFEVKGELELGRGNVFGALDAYKSARERSPKGAPERSRHERRMAELGALIESGAATEMLKAAAANQDEGAAPATGPQEDGPRREAGTTTKLRKKGGESVAEQVGDVAAGLADVVSDAASGIAEAAAEVTSELKDVAEEAVEELAEAATDVLEEVEARLASPEAGDEE